MFRYEGQAFNASAEIMKTVCRELNECEEELRVLSGMLDRNPEIPAPRQKLRKSLMKLEERETSLNLTRRKLDSIRRLYEEAEGRILDLADEDLSADRRRAADSGQDMGEKAPSENAQEAHLFIPLPRMDWTWPYSHPRLPRFYPGLRPYPFPYKPRRPLHPFPPRRPVFPDPEFIRRILMRLLPGHRRYMPIPRFELPGREREFVVLPYISGQTSILTDSRAQRRGRIGLLFGTDRS